MLMATTWRTSFSPLGEGLQVLVYARDQQDLFARICGYFDGAGFNILDAKVHTTRIGYALDSWRGTAPWFLVGGLFLGIIVGFYELAKTVWPR